MKLKGIYCLLKGKENECHKMYQLITNPISYKHLVYAATSWYPPPRLHALNDLPVVTPCSMYGIIRLHTSSTTINFLKYRCLHPHHYA